MNWLFPVIKLTVPAIISKQWLEETLCTKDKLFYLTTKKLNIVHVGIEHPKTHQTSRINTTPSMLQSATCHISLFRKWSQHYEFTTNLNFLHTNINYRSTQLTLHVRHTWQSLQFCKMFQLLTNTSSMKTTLL